MLFHLTLMLMEEMSGNVGDCRISGNLLSSLFIYTYALADDNNGVYENDFWFLQC